MNPFRTGIQDLISDSDGTNGVYNAMTPALNSTAFKNIRVRLLSYGTSGLQVQPYVEFSDDGVNWPSGSRHLMDVLITPVDGKMYKPSTWGTIDIYSPPASPKPFVRFGLYARGTTTGDPRAFQAEIEITNVEPCRSTSLTSEHQMVFGSSHLLVRVFPITGVLDATMFDEARASVALESEGEVGGSLAYQVICQEVNKPKVPTDYTTSTSISASGLTASVVGTTFTTLAPTKRYIRFVVEVIRSGGSTGNFVMGRIRTRIDLRRL